MDTYIGSKLEKKSLMIDTLANGTAIDYEVGNSKDSYVYPDKLGRIEHVFGTYKGNYADDNLCLEHEENTCVDSFNFLEVENKDI